mmetsp:Transcript_3508/g.9641  ORF Transcript_3508/g.9641 Transcript_3508/m.9641 type:complete len:347 (-) Transcript_3508:202-1242(-)|eukprot:CAMPEP_0185832712 /NCGR_PEP_ID=MMETSP1353-20130828/2245_1 /TAXON_ID=1077150 /ORGANISM="Erythrolobus australicus, Strain CCMP3124" /LENGTH=346 /DNA_ID=CAMNT_0028530921 /DNA_START=269 /DNA_END=1312 /DNA_ORIENTATION=+
MLERGAANDREGLARCIDSGATLVTEGGIETTLVFRSPHELREFAAFELMLEGLHEQYSALAPAAAQKPGAREDLLAIYGNFARVIHEAGLRPMLDTPTWRASPDYLKVLGYTERDAVELVNAKCVSYLREYFAKPDLPDVFLCGEVGPRSDAYQASLRMSVEDATKYHQAQVGALARAGVDMIHALTIPYLEEAIGVGLAASSASVPYALSFTLQEHGVLPSGMSLGDAILRCDAELAARDAVLPKYYLVNCCHPTVITLALEKDDPRRSEWLPRLRGMRCNASSKTHEELDNSTVLDDGDPHELCAHMVRIRDANPQFQVFGGCCGTDARHIQQLVCKLSAKSA